jgi:alkylation response protein AidB-like acyl-CoA dehydrogenase
MDARPSPAQHLLIATARDVLAKHCPIEHVQRLAIDQPGFDPALWRRLAELGWAGLLVPSDLGGSDGSILDVVLLVEEMGRACLPGPFISSAVVATGLVMAAASEAQRRRLLPARATGERTAALALVEAAGSFEPADVALACRVPGRLTGRKLFVRDAHAADDLIVVVREGEGVSLLWLPVDRVGIHRTRQDSIGDERLFEVTLDDVVVNGEDRLGPAAGHPRDVPAGSGEAALASALRAGALARAAEMVGAAQRVFELVVEHAKTRVQGGRPIGGYQAIQHACADMVRDVDAARGLLHAAAWRLAEGLPAGAEVAMAKAYAATACLAVARRGHQVLGAISYCDEHPIHLLHKRILAASVDCGEADRHLETVARAIGLAG